MANVAKALKMEIVGAKRKGTKDAIQGIREKNASLRRLVAELRTKVFLLERENKRLKAAIREFQIKSAQMPNVKPSKAR
jgi:hypothetical protein